MLLDYTSNPYNSSLVYNEVLGITYSDLWWNIRLIKPTNSVLADKLHEAFVQMQWRG